VVLQHLLTHRARNEAFVSLSIYLNELGLLYSNLLELGENARRGVVIGCGQDLRAQNFGTTLQRCGNLFA
jgi:hypothetical protein